MSNESGQAYGLTVLSPIQEGHEDAIKQYLAALPTGDTAPFHRTPTHTVRWVVIEQLPDPAWPAERDSKGEGKFDSDRLRSSYLLFDSNFDAGDGGLGDYLRTLVTEVPEVLEAIYGHCVGYAGLDRFPHYIDECQIRTTFFFSSYATTARGTASHVKEALRVQTGFVELVASSQGKSPAEAQARLTAFLAENRITLPVDAG